MKIGILASAGKIKNKEVLDTLMLFLQSKGYQTVLLTSPKEATDQDCVIVLGGDGAILHSSVSLAKKNIKIIGINYGNLGFLAEFERDDKLEEVDQLLQNLKNNQCRILKRSILQIQIGEKIYFALNEVAFQRNFDVTNKNTTQILKLDIITKEGITNIAGDGLLVCTPTGSTAYSLSAGGAILTPEVPIFMVTPICAFSMRSRPVVFSNNEVFEIVIKRGGCTVQIDGLSMASLKENNKIIVKKAPFTADFPIQDKLDFFAKVKNKLND